MFRLIGTVAALMILVPGQPVFASAESAIAGEPVVHNQAIMRIAQDVEDPGQAIDDLGYSVIETLGEETDRTFVVELNPFVSTSSQINKLAGNEDLVFAEPNYVFSIAGPFVSDDPKYLDGTTWGMEGASTTSANAYGSNAAGAWANGFVGSSDVYVAVIDSGINYNHRDLAANMWANAAELSGTTGVDDDGDGFVDDVYGYDFVNEDASVFDPGEHKHGTHVAGTIAAVGGNGAGVSGVSWNTKLISVKVMGADGTGTVADIIQGIDYVTMLRAKLGLDIIASNNSYGSSANSLAMQDAIRRGGDAGIVFVAAAGNDGVNNDSSSQYPANFDCSTKDRSWDCVVSVGALTSTGSLASFSNYGAESVDILAPGQQVYSTTIDDGLNGGYEYLSGTSMAAPHVTGAIALCVGSYRGVSAQDAISLLYSTGVATTSAAATTSSGKRLDAGGLAGACYDTRTTFAGNPSEVYASAIYTDRIRLDWADTVAGDYEQEIQYAKGPLGCTGTFLHLAFIGPGITSYPINNLDEAEFYCFRIRSNNQATASGYVKSNVSITWTSNLPFVGGVVKLPDGTPVANAPVKWLADGVYATLNNANAITTYTNESGEYVLQISNGTTGKLFVDVSRTANLKRVTNPQLPWGLSVGGKLTINQDITKDITVPDSHLITFDVKDENGSPVSGVELQGSALSQVCTKAGYVPFDGATNVSCEMWPTGYPGSITRSDANGQIALALVDTTHVSGGAFDIHAIFPSDFGRVETRRIVPTADATIAVTMDPTATLSGHVYMDDGTTPVAGVFVRWIGKGMYVNGDYTYAKTVTTDANGAYSMGVSADTAAVVYLSTSKYPSVATPTSPLLPWGLTATSNLTITGDQTLDLKAPPVVQYDLTVEEYESTSKVSGAKVVSDDLTFFCKSGVYSMFVGASGSGCFHLPTGYPSYAPRTNAQGQLSIALLDSSVLTTSKPSYSLSVTDPKYSTKTKNLSLTPTSSASMIVKMPAPVTISGTVYLADGVTPVANAPVKWLGDGQDGGLGNKDATTVLTDSAGHYSISASMGTPGELFVETSRYAYSSNATSPLLPWGLHAGGSVTVATDSVVDLLMPSFHYATFNVREYASNEAVDEADLETNTLSSPCKAGTYTAFIGATGSSCIYWPGGYPHSSPVADPDGVVRIGLLDTKYYTSAPSFTFAIKHPMDDARVSSRVVTVNNSNQTFTIDMPGTPSKPEQPSATAETGKVVVNWNEPWSDGGSYIDYYEVWVSLAAEGPFELVQSGSCAGQLAPNLRTCEVEGLTPGVTYYFAIIAHNVYGYGAKSLSISSTPLAETLNQTLTPTPTISGTATFSQLLTAAPGTWDDGVTLTYQWRRDGESIFGATGSTYSLVTADVGSKLSVAVTGVKTGYNAVTTSSSETATVTVSQFVLAPTPTISGTLTDGEALSLVTGTWDSGVSLSYQWYRSGVAISSETSASYTLDSADVGSQITVKVTGVKSGYETTSKTSAATTAIQAIAVVAPSLSAQSLSPTPTVSGDGLLGAELVATVGTWDSGVTLAHQWLRNNVAIPLATNTSYVLTSADLGSTISFQVTSSKAGYTQISRTSSLIGPIAEPGLLEAAIVAEMVLTPVPAISGSTYLGSTLTASPGAWDDGAILSYQWLRAGVPIFGATSSSYVLTQGDLAKKISFEVIGSKTGLTTVSKVSVETAAITASAPAPFGGGGGGGGGGAAAPTVAIPALAKALPVGSKFALFDADGKSVTATAKVEDSGKKLVLSGAGWSVDVASDSGLKVSEDGQAELAAGSSVQLGATGYEPDSTVYFYMVPKSYLQVANLWFIGFAISSEPVELGSTKVSQDGSFSFSAKPLVSAGEYILQIAGYNLDGEVTNLAISTTVTGVALASQELASWTKNLNNGSFKLYAKNVIGAGKVQMLFNGKEIAWVRAVDETDAKLREANGFYYLVRTVTLVSGRKNVLEIYVDGVRVTRSAYSY